MKSTLLLSLLASTSFASARILPGAHVLAVGASLISGPLPALAKPVWRYTSTHLNPRQANSTTSATAGTYTVVSGDTLSAIAAAEGVSTQQLEDANPGVVPTDLQVGQVLNMPSSASSTQAAASSVAAATTSSGADVTSTSENTPTAAATSTGDTSDLGSVASSDASDTDTDATQTNTTSSCGGHHHHHNSTETTGSTAQGHHNGTSNAEVTKHHKHNSTSLAAESGQCNGTSHHHHHNGTRTGTATGGPSQTAASFFIPTTATASALAVALTSSAATGDVEARAVGGFLAIMRRA
jgi:LysM repeat protein